MNLLTVKEAAEQTRLSVSWYRQRIFRREISFVKIGRRVFLEQDTIDKLVKDGVHDPIHAEP